MSYLSVVINVDTRQENLTNQQMFNGVVSRDFLAEGVINKRKLFDGFDAEFIVFVDEHEPLSETELSELKKVSDTLIIRKHNKRFEDIEQFAAFNDLNYLQALFQTRGEYIFHFDADVAAFAISKEPIQEMINQLENVDYISYPSLWSPNPVEDASFGGRYWVSTRYFCCKRSTINFSEILKCQLDYDYWKETYPVPRLCHWTEHLLSSIAWNKGKGVYYPPVRFDKFILFTWENYHKGTLPMLNNKTFEEVNNWVCSKVFHYPNNLTI
jgi:hypothetical protein